MPIAVLLTAAAIGLVYAVFALLLTAQQSNEALVLFAFIPARYDLSVLEAEPWWIGWGPAVWSLVTYAFIHGNLSHLLLNLVWLLAFGTPVARRFGSPRFLVFFLVTAVAGAAVHLALHLGQDVPVIGASAAISGAMAAAIRFVFQRGGPLGALRGGDPEAYRVPALPLSMIARDPRVLAFLLAWFGLNLLFGMGTISMPGAEESVAWEAHIGGFLAGLFSFSAFDPVPSSPEARDETSQATQIISESDQS